MKAGRLRQRQKLAALLFVLFVLGSCSRSSSDTGATPAPSFTASSVAAPLSATAAPPGTPSSVAPTSVPTPEDAEDDSAHRITEQNLESELDRLEREIQAE